MAAINYIKFNATTPLQSELRSAIRAAKENREKLEFLLAKMNAMNDDSNFEALESEFGVQAGQGDDVRNELASYLAKVTGNGQVTDVKAALDQLVAKMG